MFALIQHHKYSKTEIEEMIPYERDLYVQMLVAFIEKQKQEAEMRNKGIGR